MSQKSLGSTVMNSTIDLPSWIPPYFQQRNIDSSPDFVESIQRVIHQLDHENNDAAENNSDREPTHGIDSQKEADKQHNPSRTVGYHPKCRGNFGYTDTVPATEVLRRGREPQKL